MLDRYSESAKTLVLVAIILQVVFSLIAVFIYAAVFAVVPATTIGPGGTTVSTGFPAAGLFIVLASVFGGIGLLWILLDYFLLYKKIADGRIEETDTTSLVLGILQLLFGGLIPGILILVAHGKIGDAINNKLRNPESAV